MMPSYDEAAITRIGRGVLDCSLPKAEWTHAAHFAGACWLARHRPDCAAPDAIGAIIRRYNGATGTPNTDSGGYHATITIASMRAVSAHLAAHAADARLAAVVASLLASPFGRPDWLLAYWSRDCLFGVAARRGWVAPDIAPLPF